MDNEFKLLKNLFESLLERKYSIKKSQSQNLEITKHTN